MPLSLERLGIEVNDVRKRNLVRVVEVRVRSAGHNEKALVVAFETLERGFAEVAGMGLFAVHDQNGALDFAGVSWRPVTT